MNQILTINELVLSMAEIRNLKKGFITNFYLDMSKHSLWVSKRALYIERVRDTLFIVKKNENFWNVFFCSTTLEELSRDLQGFNEKYKDILLMYDIVGNERMLVTCKEIFDIRMNRYCSLVRMSRINAGQECKLSGDIRVASTEQAQELLDILNNHFDERTEQIPCIEEIHSLIEKGNVLVYEHEGKIVGFVIFEKSVATLYLRYWFVHPGYRNMKVGSKLLNHFFYTGKDCKRHQLWVIETNDNAIVRYEHYDFKAENLFDVVYTNKEIKYQQ